jgi:hypothetical protein
LSDIDDTPTRSFYVDSDRLRQRFNALDLFGQLLRGEIVAVVDKERRARPSSGQEPGTLSQRLIYFRHGVPVAVVHQYLKPDGTLGGSGLPDPKWLRDGDVILKFLRSP